MKVLLINPSYQTWTSNVGVGHQVPLGLLMVGGPLLDAGHEVRLLDAEEGRLSLRKVEREVRHWQPDVVMTGHAGSTPAHPICLQTLRAAKRGRSDVIGVYGGVFPTYHARGILQQESAVDVIVRGEGEATTLELMQTLAGNRVLDDVAGLSFRRETEIVETPDRAPIRPLDGFRVGWELIKNWDKYRCFGLGRAAIVQWSRGCPHHCTYCGQFGFWVNWRHRDVVQMADEIEWLHRTHQIRFFTLADENPTTHRETWKRFLEEIASRDLPIQFFATIRATDIVRDAELLPLYRKAGIQYILMGIETTDESVLQQIRKGSTTRHDFQACQLLKQNGIFSVIGHVVGLGEESWAGFRQTLRQLKLYDGDYLNAMYVTPHSWSQFAQEVAEAPVVQTDQSLWDYRHQILGQETLKPWQIFLGVKWLEVCFHLQPRKMWAMLTMRDRDLRRQTLWTLFHTALVWFGEIGDFLCRTSFARHPQTLRETVLQQQGAPRESKPKARSTSWKMNRQDAKSAKKRTGFEYSNV